MKNVIVSLRMYLFWTVAFGLAYPLLMTGAAQALFPRQANGGILFRGGQAIGAELISQKFESEKYFWERPSAVDFNPLPSGGSNLGPISESLKKAVGERTARLRAAHGDAAIPQDLLFASASGLDPEISPEAAQYQMSRIAKFRGMESAAVQALVSQFTEGRQWGLFGEPRVNVLKLNLALDSIQGINTAPTAISK